MANTAKVRLIVEYDGVNWLIWQGNVLMLTTNKPSDLVLACRGKIRAPQAKPDARPRLETTEEFLARGGKIKKVKATAEGFVFSEEEIELAIKQVHGKLPASAQAQATEEGKELEDAAAPSA